MLQFLECRKLGEEKDLEESWLCYEPYYLSGIFNNCCTNNRIFPGSLCAGTALLCESAFFVVLVIILTRY